MIIRDRFFNTPDSYKWRKTYAWLPVKTISGKMVWLREIYKQKFWASIDGKITWGGNYQLHYMVEYAEFFDIIKMENYDN